MPVDATPCLMASPATWGGRDEAVELRETHISWVALIGARAYKVKKPICLPFLDFSSLAKRRVACLAEVRLNRTLAPSIYLGVRSLVPGPDGPTLGPPAAESAVEYAVEMRRFDEHQTLQARIERGEIAATEVVAALGVRLAEFHAAAPMVREPGAADRVCSTLDGTFASLAELCDAEMIPRISALQRFAGTFVRTRRTQLDSRGDSGSVREGHGDLRAEHVALGNRLEVVDCVEFSQELRRLDVADDLSFLAMDLVRLGREDLADVLLAAYRSQGGDVGDDALVAGFGVHRALVRAKVALLRATQTTGPEATMSRDEADSLVAVAEQLAWRARGPMLLVISGPAASGKSTLARAISGRSRLTVISSDVLRKRRAGLQPTERGTDSLYDAAHDKETYAAMYELAGAALANGRGVVLDATFRSVEERVAVAELARRTGVRLLVVECQVADSLLLRRACVRKGDPDRISDADGAVATRQARDWRPWTTVAPKQLLLLPGDMSSNEQVDAIVERLDQGRD